VQQVITVTITPSLQNYTFTPPSVNFTLNSDITINFTASKVLGLHPSDFDSAQSDISFYPNPANEILYFSKETPFEIHDLLGKLVLHSEKYVNSVNINVLKAGVYFITIGNRKEKFVKEE
jgi:hypothetical protein